MAAGCPFGGFLTEMAAMESDDQDFEEEEVWGCDKMKTTSKRSSSKKNPSPPSRTTQRSIASKAAGRHQPGLIPPRRSSAPVNIPDWSKILKQPGSTRNPWDDAACNDYNGGGCGRRHSRYLYSDEEEEEEEGMMPPHELLARRNARRGITCSSMCEGVGRTLKGRDLSNLRNTILSKTGFLE